MMKLKHTKNGNIQLTLSPEAASLLKNILNCSSDIDQEDQRDGQEEVSWDIFHLLDDTGISSIA